MAPNPITYPMLLQGPSFSSQSSVPLCNSPSVPTQSPNVLAKSKSSLSLSRLVSTTYSHEFPVRTAIARWCRATHHAITYFVKCLSVTRQPKCLLRTAMLSILQNALHSGIPDCHHPDTLYYDSVAASRGNAHTGWLPLITLINHKTKFPACHGYKPMMWQHAVCGGKLGGRAPGTAARLRLQAIPESQS